MAIGGFHAISGDTNNNCEMNKCWWTNNTIQYNTIQYNTTQYNTIQYNTIQYNTIRVYCENTPSYNNGVLSQTEPKSGSVKQSELMSDLLFSVHQHGGDDVTWKPPIDWQFSRPARLIFPWEASRPIGNICTYRMRVEKFYSCGLSVL